MKLAVILTGLLLLVVGAVHSVPVTESNLAVGAEEEMPAATEEMPGNTENTGMPNTGQELHPHI